MKTGRERLLKIFGIILSIPLILAFCLITLPYCLMALTGATLLLSDMQRSMTWKSKTSPLEVDVVQDLCQKFNLPENDHRCQANATVYARDFHLTIHDAFFSDTEKTVTYDDVESKLGEYKISCSENWPGSGNTEYFDCEYDLRGDRILRFTISFNAKDKTALQFYGSGP